MIRISLIKKNFKKEKLISKYKVNRILLKKKIITTSLFYKKLKYSKLLQELPKNSSKIKFINRCWRTGRSKGFYKDFGLSRHSIRYYMERGLLPGLIKSSW